MLYYFLWDIEWIFIKLIIDSIENEFIFILIFCWVCLVVVFFKLINNINVVDGIVNYLFLIWSEIYISIEYFNDILEIL